MRAGPFRVVVTRISADSYSKAPAQITTSLHLARQHGASLYLVRPERPLNRAVFDLRSPEVRILPEVPWLSARLRRHWDRVLRLGDPAAAAALDTSASFNAHPIPLRFSAVAERDTARRAAALGLTAGSRIVTLHVRESGFKGSLGQEERNKDEIRSARIETYFEAIDALVGLGYTVVRIGDPTMTPIVRPGVVDLATAPVRDEWIELWSMMRAEFFLASQSGPYALAIMTSTPVLMVNVVNPLAAYPHRQRDLYILKHVTERATGRALPLRALTMGESREPDRFAFTDNSSAEILEGVREMLGALQEWPPATPAQQEYAGVVREIQVSDRSRAKLAGKGFTAVPFAREGRIAAFFAERHLRAAGDGDGAPIRPA